MAKRFINSQDDSNKDGKEPSTPYKEGDVVRQYVFHEIIGKGGFATIYRVHHKLFNQDFAAKVLIVENADKWETFQQEVEALKHLNHEHIIRLYDIFREGNVAVMILELCENGSLQKEIGNKGLSSERLISVTHQIVKALLYCHENNYPHCDLKPQNILLDRYGRVKLSDFGLTIFQDHKDAMVCKFKGTPLYTPPEIIRKIPHSKFLADIWSLGVMIAVMASGKHPWGSNSYAQMKKDICAGMIYIPKKIPDDIYSIIKRTVVVQPDKRMRLEDIDDMQVFRQFMPLQNTIKMRIPFSSSINNMNENRRNTQFHIRSDRTASSFNSSMDSMKRVKFEFQSNDPNINNGKTVSNSVNNVLKPSQLNLQNNQLADIHENANFTASAQNLQVYHQGDIFTQKDVENADNNNNCNNNNQPFLNNNHQNFKQNSMMSNCNLNNSDNFMNPNPSNTTFNINGRTPGHESCSMMSLNQYIIPEITQNREVNQNNENAFNEPLNCISQKQHHRIDNVKQANTPFQPLYRSKTSAILMKKMILQGHRQLPISGKTGAKVASEQNVRFEKIDQGKEQKVKDQMLPLGRRFSKNLVSLKSD